MNGRKKISVKANRRKGKILLCSLLLFISGFFIVSLSSAQDMHKLRSSNLIIEGRAYYGWTMAHHLEMQIFQKHYPAFEISLMKATYGKTRWEYMWGYPLIGISYWYSTLGNTPWLGHAHAIFPFINFRLYHKNACTFSFRLGVGLGYLTKRYDPIENYKNLAIGSHLNGAVNLMFEWRWRIGPRLMASIGAGLMHFSNGTIKTPNFGLNMPAVNVAFAYRLSKENPYQRNKLMPTLESFEFDGKKTVRLDISAAIAIKDMSAQLGVGNRYMVYTIFGNIMKPVSYKTRFGLGFDISYDASDVMVLELQGKPPDKMIKVVKTGFTAAFELSFARTAMVFNAGFYLSGLDQSDGRFYEKLALRFDITDKLFANFTLKAHYARADYVAIGIGYKFNLKYY